VLVTGADVFELNPNRLDQTRRLAWRDGVIYGQEKRSVYERDAHAALFESLADGRLVGQLAFVDVSARRQPQAELAVPVEKDASVVDDEDRDGELARDARAGRRRVRGRRGRRPRRGAA
jgi:hypothetical protein